MIQSFKEGFIFTPFFGITLTLFSFWIGSIINKKTKLIIFNPLIIGIAVIIVFLKAFNIGYDEYYAGGSMINFLITPATVAFAIPLYKQVEVLKKNLFAILIAVLSGSSACIVSIFFMCKLMGVSSSIFFGLVPKSVTTAIAIGITEEINGITSVTVCAVIITGILGAVFATTFAKIFKIKNKIAFGLAIGTSAHAVGTAKAMEIDELVGAMSSLAIVVAGVMTVAIAPVAAMIY